MYRSPSVARGGDPDHNLPMTRDASYLVAPSPGDSRLMQRVHGTDQDGRAVETSVTVERPLELFLNSREIVTLMTIGDYPECLAIGYLLNQNMLRPEDVVTAVEYDEIAEAVAVRTEREKIGRAHV